MKLAGHCVLGIINAFLIVLRSEYEASTSEGGAPLDPLFLEAA